MKFIRPPFALRKIYPQLVWRVPTREPSVFLTFDDGPIPVLTPFILDTLKAHQIKATFFCVGENTLKYPELFQRIQTEGHRIGNHSHNHLNGWKTPNTNYFQNVEKANVHIQSNLFRPPYGRIRHSQIEQLKKHYQLIMWDVLSYDYHPKVTPEQCLNNVLRKTRNGSILVFHDNLKAQRNVEYALPKAIQLLHQRGFNFQTL